MESLIVLYSALAVFGIGVTLIDLLGFLDHFGPDNGGDHGTGHHDDGDGHGQGSHHDEDGNHHHIAELPDRTKQLGPYVSSGEAGTRLVAKAITIIRTGVYFSLGAGPTGLFATLTGVSVLSGLLWAAGAGLVITVLARGLRSFMQKDLDSTITPEELLMDLAEVTVPLLPGAMGKIIVRRYGHELELYARAKDGSQEFKKGTKVRIVDFNEDCYWVEKESSL